MYTHSLNAHTTSQKLEEASPKRSCVRLRLLRTYPGRNASMYAEHIFRISFSSISSQSFVFPAHVRARFQPDVLAYLCNFGLQQTSRRSIATVRQTSAV